MGRLMNHRQCAGNNPFNPACAVLWRTVTWREGTADPLVSRFARQQKMSTEGV